MESQHTNDVRPALTPTRQVIKTVFAVLVSAVSIVASIVGGYIALDQYLSKPLIRMSVVDNQCLTKVESISNLVAKFSFNGREVKSLWVSKLQFVNDCRRNIIGLPGHDLMYSNLVVSISHEHNAISVEVEEADFDVSVVTLNSGISLSFAKWKPHQFCRLKVYSEGLFDATKYAHPEFLAEVEPFTQGDMIVSGYREESPEGPVLRHLPFWLYIVLKWVGIVVYAIGFLACVIYICWNWLKLILRRRWDRRYASKVEAILTARSTSNEGGWDIDLLEKDFWIKNHIPKPPTKSSFIVRGCINRGEVIGQHIAYGFLALITAIALMSLIYIR